MPEKKKWGDRMIRVSIRFFTNNLPKSADDRTAEFKGTIHLDRNKSRKIERDLIHFNSKDELIPKFFELLKNNKVTLIEHVGTAKVDYDAFLRSEPKV